MLSVGGGPFQQQASALIKQIQGTYQAITSGGTEGLFVGLILPPLYTIAKKTNRRWWQRKKKSEAA